MSVTIGKDYRVYRAAITNPGVAADQPAVHSEFASRIAILVYNPAGHTLVMRCNTVLEFGGQINEIPTGASPEVTMSNIHGLKVGENVTISDSNCVPSIDGIHAITAATDRTITFTPGAAVTTSGNYAIYSATARAFRKRDVHDNLDVTISDTQELLFDHSGGTFNVEILTAGSTAGPYADADKVDIFWGAI